eukprot:g4371.t1
MDASFLSLTGVFDEATCDSLRMMLKSSLPQHVQHGVSVRYDVKTGRFSGLPKGWNPAYVQNHFGVCLKDCPLRKRRAVSCASDSKTKTTTSKFPVLPTLMWVQLSRCGFLDTEGLFRKEPSGRVRDKVRHDIERNQFRGCDDPHVCASILKQWYRELRPCLLDRFGHDPLAYSVASETNAAAKDLVAMFPSALERDVFLWTVDRMIDVSRREKSNRMSRDAIAIVFAMALISSPDDEGTTPTTTGSPDLFAARMKRLKALQSAVRDFLLRAMAWRVESGAYAAAEEEREEEEEDTGTETTVATKCELTTPRSLLTPARRHNATSNIDNAALQRRAEALTPSTSPPILAPAPPASPGTSAKSPPPPTTTTTTTKARPTIPQVVNVPSPDQWIQSGDSRWMPDNEARVCPSCGNTFSMFLRKHHCRSCGKIFCKICCPVVLAPYLQQARTSSFESTRRVRFCAPCKSLAPVPSSRTKKRTVVTTWTATSGTLDAETVKALQRFLATTGAAVPVDGFFEASAETRYTLSEPTNRALYAFLCVNSPSDEKGFFPTAKTLVRALQAYLSRRKSWTTPRSGDGLHRSRKKTSLSSPAVRYDWDDTLDPSSLPRLSSIPPPPSYPRPKMIPLTCAEMENDRAFELINGVSSSSATTTRRKDSWGFTIGDCDSLTGRLFDAQVVHEKHLQEVRDDAERMLAHKRALATLSGKTEDAHGAIQRELRERAEALVQSEASARHAEDAHARDLAALERRLDDATKRAEATTRSEAAALSSEARAHREVLENVSREHAEALVRSEASARHAEDAHARDLATLERRLDDAMKRAEATTRSEAAALSSAGRAHREALENVSRKHAEALVRSEASARHAEDAHARDLATLEHRLDDATKRAEATTRSEVAALSSAGRAHREALENVSREHAEALVRSEASAWHAEDAHARDLATLERRLDDATKRAEATTRSEAAALSSAGRAHREALENVSREHAEALVRSEASARHAEDTHARDLATLERRLDDATKRAEATTRSEAAALSSAGRAHREALENVSREHAEALARSEASARDLAAKHGAIVTRLEVQLDEATKRAEARRRSDATKTTSFVDRLERGAGIAVRKYGTKGKPKDQVLHLTADGRLTWNSRKGRSVALTSIVSTVPGPFRTSFVYAPGSFDVLVVQDGGCAPGYDAAAAYVCERFERSGRRVHVALRGFKSVVSSQSDDFGLLVRDARLRTEVYGSVPRVFDAEDLLSRRGGASFRDERYPAFRDKVHVAARNMLRLGVRTVVCIGGNGTMKGARALARAVRKEKEAREDFKTSSSSASSPATTNFYFIPVTIDADVALTESVGQHTGAERGAEKLRCYLADAHTHRRCYIKEMMGADGGFHALYSCVGAGAHYAALDDPLSDAELVRIARKISERRSSVIVVAEGYARELRRALAKRMRARRDGGHEGCGDDAKTSGEYDEDGLGLLSDAMRTTSGRPEQRDLLSAASFLHYQLKRTGALDPKKKIVCEPFARDIRGAAPNARDLLLARQMASKIVELEVSGTTKDVVGAMPTVNAGVVSFVPFAKMGTSNAVDNATRMLADRL